MNCKECGFELSKEDKFCPKCGNKVNMFATQTKEAGSDDVSRPTEKDYILKKSFGFALFVIVMIVLFFLGAIIFVKIHRDKEINSEKNIVEQPTESTNDAETDSASRDESQAEIETEMVDIEETSLSEPSSFYKLTQDLDYNEIIEKYSIGSFNTENRSENYSGNIGDIVEAYHDIDINGDGLSDVIERESMSDNGRKYSIVLNNGETVEGPVFNAVKENFTDYGDVVEFFDINKDGMDEILFTQYGKFVRYHEVMVYASFLMIQNNEGEWEIVDMLFPDKYTASLNSIYGIELIEDGVVLLADYATNDNGNCYDVFKFELDDEGFSLAFNSSDCVGEYWPVKYNHSNTMASGLDEESKKAYEKVLEDLYWNRVFPDGSSVEDHLTGDTYTAYFGMTDYNGDGKKELKIRLDEDFKTNALVRIYGYTDEKGIYEIEEGYFIYNIYSGNSRSKDKDNYEIAKYKPGDEVIDQAFVQVWCKNDWDLTEKWNSDFPDARDKDGDGIIYSLMEQALWVYASSDNDEYWLDKYVYDESELMDKIDTLANGAKILNETVCVLPKGNRLLYEQSGKFLELE